MMTVKEVANMLSLSPVGIKKAIRDKRLSASKQNGRWMIEIDHLEYYIKNRWNRNRSLYKGIPLFDKSKGEYSAKEVAKFLNCSIQHVYYACREEKLKTARKGSAWIINIQDIKKYSKIMKFGKRRKIISTQLHNKEKKNG
ncbi:MAG: helix-turn-helix domain-containing protein [Methanobacterium sp.]